MSSMYPNNLTSTTSSSATSSGYESNWDPWKAFDGDNTTGWTPYGGATTSSPKWLQRDLGKAYKIDHVVVKFVSQSECFTQGSLQGSMDGSTFTELATYSGNSSTELIINVDNENTFRYVRLIATGIYSGWGRVMEVQTYVTAESNPGVRIQLRHDTSSNWSLVNPVLLEGEIGLETDTNKQKMGDGTTAWNSLPYMGSDVDQTFNGTSANAQSGVAINGAGFLKNTATGSNSLQILGNNSTGGNYCTRVGESANGTYDYSTAIGYNANCSRNALAIGANSSALGNGGSTSAASATALGFGAYASGNHAVAIGSYTNARGTYSIGIGSYYSNGVSYGNTYISGDYSVGIGGEVYIPSTNCTCLGYHARSNNGTYSTAIGSNSETSAASAIQLGYGTNSTANTFSVGFYGQNSGTPYTLLDGTTGLIPVARVPGSVSMPDSTQVTPLTVPTTATSMTNNLGDGWLYLAATQTGTSGYAFMSIDNAYQLVGQPTNVNGYEIRLLMPIKNGSTYELTYNDVNIFYFAFFKAIGG